MVRRRQSLGHLEALEGVAENLEDLEDWLKIANGLARLIGRC